MKKIVYLFTLVTFLALICIFSTPTFSIAYADSNIIHESGRWDTINTNDVTGARIVEQAKIYLNMGIGLTQQGTRYSNSP